MEVPPSTTEWLQNGRLRKTKLAETIKDNMEVLKQTSTEFQNVFWFLTEQTFNAAKNMEDFKHEVDTSCSSLKSSNLNITSRIKELTNLNMFYDGDIREFISKVETVCDTDEERLLITPSYLKGIAKSAWRSIPDKSDWQIVKEKLINAIDPSSGKKSSLELKNEIIKMTPRDKETGRYFLIRVQEKITLAQEELKKCWSCDEQAELLLQALQNTSYGNILTRKTKENDLDYAEIADAFLTLGRETYVKKKFSINENNFKKDPKRDFNKDFKKNKKGFKKKPSYNKVNHITASSDEEELLSSSEINKIEHYICCLVGNTPIVEIFLHGITQKALIDTGATTSVLSVKLFNMLLDYSKNKNIKKFTYRPKCPVIIRNASGKEIKSFGIVSLKFGKTNKKSSKTDFIVADLAKDIDIIIGTNLIFSKNNKWILKALNNIQLSEKLTHTVNKISIFDKYPTIIASDDYNKPSEIIEPVALELNDQVIIKEKARPIPFAVKDKVNSMIKQMVNAGILEKSKSPYSNPALIINKDGKLRLVLDSRKLNSILKKNSIPLPRIQDTIYKMGSKSMFCCLDLAKGYLQVPLTQSSRQLTAFSIPGVGHYQFCSLPLGLTVAPGEFQARMEHIFRKQIDDGNVVIYIDDILIAGNSKQECEIILHEVLSILDKYQLKLNPSKCQLFQTRITYLGVELGNGTVKISEKNSNKFLNFSTPTTKKQLASFNGLFNYFRFYIPQAATLLKPLKDAENREKFQWLPNDELAFQKCKDAIRDAKILHSPNMATALSNKESFTLCTDASGDAIGSVLLQNHKVVGFYSRTLKGAERNYVALDLEALAILSSLKHFKVLLYGLPITIITDHKPLTFLLTKKDLSARLTKWMIQLQAFQLNIVYSPGKENYVADCLSRCIQPEPISPQDDVEEFPEEHIIAIETTTAMLNKPWTNLPNRMEWSAFQESDNKLNQLMKAIKNDEWSISTSSPEMNFLLKQKSNLIINDKHQLTTKDGKLILSHTLANKVALFCHKNHESYSNILQRMNKRFITYQLPSLIQNIIRSCSICQITYQKRSKTHNWKECTKPLQRGHLDIGHCSLYKSDFFVLKDSFSNFLFADWIPKQDASTICNKLQRIFELTGAWSELVLDNQTSLAGNHMRQFLSSFGTKHTLSIVKQHNTNGAAERAIRSIKDQLYKEKTLGNGKEMALRNTLTRLRCNPYKDGTPYTKFYNDPERLPNKTLELSLDIGTKEEIFSPPLDGYFQRKPDINKQWSKAKILKKLSKHTYLIEDIIDGTHHIRTDKCTKIIHKPSGKTF